VSTEAAPEAELDAELRTAQASATAEIPAEGPPDDSYRGVTREGFRILGRGMREQWRLFSIAVIGSLVYGALTVADAWVLGWATDEVIVPSFEQGRLETGMALAAVALFLGVATVRALGVIARRLIGGVVNYRLLADYRRQVTRRYLELPMSWHHRHPTGQLLSNANSDVEATWAVMMPLPMAVGVMAMLLVAVIAMFAADVVLTLVGLAVFPLLFAINVGYQRLLSPRVTRSQELRAVTSAVAHESFDGALVVATLGRAGEETDRFAKVTDDLRAANVSAGRVRSAFDPLLEALPNVGILLVVGLGVERVLSGAADPGDVVQVAYLFTVIAFPVRSFGWVLGELPRAVVGWRRVHAVLDASGQMTYGSRSVPGDGPVRLSEPHLQAWVGRQHRPNWLAPVPGCAVPQQQDRHIRIGGQELFQVACAHRRVQPVALQHHFPSCAQVKRPVETGLRALGIGRDDRCLPARRPHPHRRRLQIERGFILRQDHRRGRILRDVDQFFSSNSSKAMTSASRRDL